jgi:hypothetical protein
MWSDRMPEAAAYHALVRAASADVPAPLTVLART